MSDGIAVRVEDVSKLYRLGKRRLRHDTLRDLLSEAMPKPFRRRDASGFPDGDERSGEDLWALRDVSFQVRHGEVVGIIGANGAGKSTLFKILSRITEPTGGRVEIRGRLGSLLEVGTGFDPELTGRENVYLNGAILGMKRRETQRRFDEIVEFSEVGRFIDTPVKRYSSGMYTRLAFAVAAHLEPDILIVDEVLAVGDAAFQRKCLGKMGNVAKTGRTVLFVSHNMMAVEDLCDRVVWLKDGRVAEVGRPGAVVSSYLKGSFSTGAERVWEDPDTAPGTGDVRLRRVCVRPEGGSPADEISVRAPFVMEIEYHSLRPDTYLSPSVALYNEHGVVVFTSAPPHDPAGRERGDPAGLYRHVCRVPGDLLNNGVHRVSLYVDKNTRTVLQEDDILTFDVRDAVEMRDGWHGEWVGAVRPMLDWTSELVEPSDRKANGGRRE
ncbi:MAG: ABC transporter ATP-binding protein [Rubrobacteraceae bacterium]